MTVGELITKLLEFPADLPVKIDMDEGEFSVEGVELAPRSDFVWIVS